MRILCTTLILAAWLCGRFAMAADLDVIPATADARAFIVLSGEITSGDADRLAALLGQHDDAIVFLHSNGGLVREALRMGMMLREHGAAAAVSSGDICLSSCALVWVGASRRYLSTQGRIGAHAAYVRDGASVETSGIANAEIGAYLARLGLGDAAVRFFTVAKPEEMLDLTPELARIVGIDVILLDEAVSAAVQSPLPEPDAALIQTAVRYSSYVVLDGICRPYLAPDPGTMAGGILRNSPSDPGNPEQAEASAAASEILEDRFRDTGILLTCLEVEAFLRRSRLSTGIGGPSFSCSQGATQTEIALCVTPDLWPRDRAMNEIYFYVRGLADVALRKQILTEQRAWLARRNACEADVQCLRQRYDERLWDFRAVQLQ